ncbi:hypothetical protein [Dactylosporangium salmoneum]|uniref:Uncharacterized protein n=1 Tax=Dactylosporangium salmoneum TaxID=53361 RepID=A0ABN3GAF7_9ACTN
MTAEDAAYRALAVFRIPAAERREFAAKVAATVANVPTGMLPNVVELGHDGGLAGDLFHDVPLCVSIYKRREAAGAAVVAAARALLEGSAS